MEFVQFWAIETNTQSLKQPDSEEFCPKIFFFKDKTHNNNGKYDVFQFFWHTMLESTVSKKIFKLFVEKTFEKAQHTLCLWNIGQSVDIEDG